MKKTYMKPAISVMAMETAAILAGSVSSYDRMTSSDVADDGFDFSVSNKNQFSKEHTFDAWED